MVRLTVWKATPPLLFAQTVNIVRVMLTDGVPLMIPLLKLSPDGSNGLMLHVSAVPLVTVGVIVAIAIPRINVMFSGL